MKWAAYVLAFAVSALLIPSALIHLDNPYLFLSSVWAYDLVPRAAGPVLAEWIMWLQVAIVCGLWLGWRTRRPAFVAACVMFACFALAQFLAHWRGLNVACGCYDSGEDNPISWRSIALAAGAAVVALLGAVASRRPALSTGGANMARRAFSLIELLVVMAIIAILIGLLLAAVQKVRAGATKVDCANRIRQVALACLQYADANRTLPPGCTVGPDEDSPTLFAGYTLFILPFVQQEAMYQQAMEDFRAQQWYHSVEAHRNFAVAVPVYVCPFDWRVSRPRVVPRYGYKAAFTSYLGVCGTDCMVPRPDGLIYTDSATRLNEVTDGLAYTLMIGERPPSGDLRFGWWYAGVGQQNSGSTDMILGVRERNFLNEYDCPARQPSEFQHSTFSDECNVLHFWSPHGGGAHFAFGDGSARFMLYTSKDIMPALATRSGGESISID